jgi:predicted SnoaL-like aldol condensation-catalyzing enzyme
MLMAVTGAAHRLLARAAHHDRPTSHEESTPMTTREEASALVQRLQECFNTRQFDQADDLVTTGYRTHPLGTTGFEAGKDAWRQVTALFPGMRVAADEILVDGDKITVRSSVEGAGTAGTPDGEPRPMLIEIFRVEDGRLAEWWGSTWLPRLPEP